jgi:hypothetical protein
MASHRRTTAAGARHGVPRRRPISPAPQQTFIERYRGAIIGGVVAAIFIVLAAIFVLKFGPSNQGKEAAAGAQPADPTLVAAVTQIPAATFDAVGAGSANNPPKAMSGAPALTQDGKPELLYVGGEYCPYCAAERWAMVAALSRFGSFSGLQTIRSASGDVFPSTATFTFYGSTFSSDSIAFTPVEQYTNQPSDNGYTSLQNLTAEQQAIVNKYDAPPYTAGGIPFLNFANQYAFSGATYNPGVLAGMDWQQIAAQLKDPSSPQAQGILGSANLISATICRLTNQQPAAVCGSAGVQKAAALLGKS